MRYIVFFILSSIAFAGKAAAGWVETIPNDSLLLQYNAAFESYEKKDYIAAYESFQKVRSVLLRDSSAIYYPLEKSYAEVSYALGLKENILDVMHRLKTSCDTSQDSEIRAGYAKICGDYYLLCQRYGDAERALQEALALTGQNPYGMQNFIWKTQVELADVYYELKDYDRCLAKLDSALVVMQPSQARESVATVAEIRNVRMQRAICLARLKRYAEALKELSLSKGSGTSDSREYAEWLRVKAKILMLRYDDTGRYDDEARKCYEQYFTLSRHYVVEHFARMTESEREQYWMAERPFVTDCYRLEGHAPSLLYDVALYSKALLLQLRSKGSGTARRHSMATWKDVQARLTATECAVEYVQYERNGEDYLGALVITKAMGQPVFVVITKVKDLNDMKLSDGSVLSQALLSSNGSDKNVLYTDSLVSTRVWPEAIVKAIGRCDKVYFSPDGLFNLLSVEYLVPKVLERVAMYRMTSTRELVAPDNKTPKGGKVLLCGGVNYDDGLRSTHDGVNDPVAYSIMSKEVYELPYLKGTKEEIDSILGLRSKGVIALYDVNVTEDTLRQLMPQCRIVHIATHGHFAEQDKRSTELVAASSDTQLSKSCLFLSGVMKNLKDRSFDAAHDRDGILSAREVAEMDLSRVDMVVLSACLSGAGTLTPDGVYGLQRGLKAAGAGAIIVSMWEVSDAVTVALMNLLYRNIGRGMSLHDSFYAARGMLRGMVFEKTYGSRSRGRVFTKKTSFDRPEYYDAFILIE